jgi:hypothetical protein
LKTLKNLLGSMLYAKDLQVLKKTPASRSIENGHELELNDGYTSKSKKISLPVVLLEEKTSVANIVTAEQQHVLDAVVVRNMKTRKTMTHMVRRRVGVRMRMRTGPAWDALVMVFLCCGAWACRRTWWPASCSSACSSDPMGAR